VVARTWDEQCEGSSQIESGFWAGSRKPPKKNQPFSNMHVCSQIFAEFACTSRPYPVMMEMLRECSHRKSVMNEDEAFRALICRVRAGDAQAVKELLQRYGPAIRITVRVHLRDSALRRLLDSEDIWQSVFASFFLRTLPGSTTWTSPPN
jgi:hypothetical protein